MDVWSGLQLFCAATTVALNYSRCGTDTLQVQSVRVLPLRLGSGELEPPGKKKKKKNMQHFNFSISARNTAIRYETDCVEWTQEQTNN